MSTIPPAIREVVRALHTAGHQAFLVGGCVRDMLRGAQPKDFDVATSAVPAEVQQTFKRVIPTGIQHGTVTVVVGPRPGVHVEVTTFRTEGEYKDGRRPETVAFHTEVEADLSRRDFTINAMALDPETQRLVDPFGGQQDLAARTIRCVGSARDRFTEDGLRCLRAVRFATVLDFALEPETERAIAPTIPIFRKVAMERVREELQKILVAPSAARGLHLLQSTGLLGAFLPEAQDFDAAAAAPVDLDVRLAVLLARAEQPGAAIDRLKLPVVTQKHVLALIAHRGAPADDAPDKALRVWLAGVGVADLAPQLAVVRALGRDTTRLEARLSAMTADPLTPKQLALNGAQIMAALGVSPGPVVGQATRFLMDQILSDPAKNTAESLKSLLATFRP